MEVFNVTTTENHNLPLITGNMANDVELHMNNLSVAVDDELKKIAADVGNIDSLTTEQKTNIVQALNGLNTKFNSHTAHFNNHTAESAKKHIHSSGSNANGRWIKFDDGTMIVSGAYAESSLNIAADTRKSVVLPFAAEFSAVDPAVGGNVLTVDSDGNMLQTKLSHVGRTVASSATRAIATVIHSGVNEWGTSGRTLSKIEIQYIAIGRWKV